MSEDSAELETEIDAAEELDSPSGAPPAKVGSATQSGSSGDGGRRPSKAPVQHGFFERLGQFVRDTRAEMRRVSWPTAVLVKNTTIITLVAVVFFAAYLFAVDRVWSFLIGRLKGLLGG